MAYKHKTVAHLETTHAEVKFLVANRGGLYPDEVMFDGIPMRDGLAKLCEAVRKHYKDIAFMCDGDATSFYGDYRTRKIDAIWAYFPGDTYALVRMAYEPDSAYHIKARTVANAKYATHNSQHHMVTTTNLAKAVNHVKTYLRPYTTDEMAKISYGDFRSAATDHKSKTGVAVCSTKSDVTNHNGFVAELENLLMSDYTFINRELRDNCVAYVNAVREEKAQQQGRINGAYVHVRMVGEQQVFDVIRTQKCVTEMYSLQRYHTDKIETYTSDTLPESIVSKLAVLSMLECGEYLADTGMKDSDVTFWVQL